MTAVYILSAIAAVIAVIIFIPIDLAFSASYIEKNGEISLFIRYFLIKIKILPAEKKEKTEKKTRKEKSAKEAGKPKKEKQPLSKTVTFFKCVIEETWEDIIKLAKHFFTHTLETKKLFINANIGAGNPMYTGMAYGAANALIYNAVSFADRHSKLGEWNVDLSSDFDKFIMEGGVETVIRTRIAYVIRLGFMAALLLLKILRINRRIKKNG